LLAKILGVSPPKVTRLYNDDYRLDERRKEWEFALLLYVLLAMPSLSRKRRNEILS